MLLPYLTTKLDPTLRATYNFEYAVAQAHDGEDEAKGRKPKNSAASMPRAESSFL